MDNTFFRIRRIGSSPDDFLEGYYNASPEEMLLPGTEVVRFDNGMCYYSLYLDREQKQSLFYPHNFTVHRNSHYDIEITGVKHAGYAGFPESLSIYPDGITRSGTERALEYTIK